MTIGDITAMQCPGAAPKVGRKRRASQGTYLGVLLGFLVSTIHGWPVEAQRLHEFAPSGKSHFICHPPVAAQSVMDNKVACVQPELAEPENVMVQGSK